MSLFKRISSTVSASIDQVVGELENHDAVIEATIHDLKKKIAAAHIRHERVQAEASTLQKQIKQNHSDAKRWRQRATDCATDDEKKALSCIRRARQCEQQAIELEESYLQYSHTAEKISQDIQNTESRARDMKQKHDLMRARQSSCNAMKATRHSSVDTVTELDNTFERWELKLRGSEIMSDSFDQKTTYDSFEQEFTEQEEAEGLRAELDELRGTVNKDSDK